MQVPLETLNESVVPPTEPRKGVNSPKRAGPSTKTALRKKSLIGASVVAGMLLLGLLALWASGVLKVKTPDGTIVLENLPPDSDVTVDGNKVTVKWGSDGSSAEITVKPGTRNVQAVHKGVKVIGKEVEIEQGGRKVLTAMLEPPQDGVPAEAAAENKGFVPLFNGKDMTGWKTQPQWDGGWHVDNGVLIWSRAGSSLLGTERDDYRDFHLRVETRIGDGVYAQLIVRNAFAQPGWSRDGYFIVLNSTNGNENKTGGLIVGPGRPFVNVSKSPVPPNHWFTLEVIAEGNRIVVKVNGQTTVDYADPELRFARGHITLWGKRDLEYRKIEIKELPPGEANHMRPAETATEPSNPVPAKSGVPAEAAADNKGFVPLFNGKDLTGWQGYEDVWSVKDGEIVGRNEKPLAFSTYLLTNDKFSDFRLTFSSKLVESEMHSGIAFWGEVKPDVSKQPEKDRTKHTYAGHLVMFPSGYGLYDLFGRNGLPVDGKPARKVGKQHDWNDIEILAQGNRIRVAVNGVQVVDLARSGTKAD